MFAPMEAEIVGGIKIKDAIFIGDEFAAQDLEFVAANKVTHIINTAGRQIPNHWEPIGVQYLTYYWMDLDSQLILDSKDQVAEETFEFIQDAMSKGESVLVHSVKGQNRSSVIIAAYLIKKYNWTLLKTLQFLSSRRSDLEIRASFLQQLSGFENRLMKYSNIRHTVNWNEISERAIQWENEEVIIRNTFLNSQMRMDMEGGPLYPRIPPAKPQTAPIGGKRKVPIRWADQGEQKNKIVVEGATNAGYRNLCTVIEGEEDMANRDTIQTVTVHKTTDYTALNSIIKGGMKNSRMEDIVGRGGSQVFGTGHNTEGEMGESVLGDLIREAKTENLLQGGNKMGVGNIGEHEEIHGHIREDIIEGLRGEKAGILGNKEIKERKQEEGKVVQMSLHHKLEEDRNSSKNIINNGSKNKEEISVVSKEKRREIKRIIPRQERERRPHLVHPHPPATNSDLLNREEMDAQIPRASSLSSRPKGESNLEDDSRPTKPSLLSHKNRPNPNNSDKSPKGLVRESEIGKKRIESNGDSSNPAKQINIVDFLKELKQIGEKKKVSGGHLDVASGVGVGIRSGTAGSERDKKSTLARSAIPLTTNPPPKNHSYDLAKIPHPTDSRRNKTRNTHKIYKSESDSYGGLGHSSVGGVTNIINNNNINNYYIHPPTSNYPSSFQGYSNSKVGATGNNAAEKLSKKKVKVKKGTIQQRASSVKSTREVLNSPKSLHMLKPSRDPEFPAYLKDSNTIKDSPLRSIKLGSNKKGLLVPSGITGVSMNIAGGHASFPQRVFPNEELGGIGDGMSISGSGRGKGMLINNFVGSNVGASTATQITGYNRPNSKNLPIKATSDAINIYKNDKVPYLHPSHNILNKKELGLSGGSIRMRKNRPANYRPSSPGIKGKIMAMESPYSIYSQQNLSSKAGKGSKVGRMGEHTDSHIHSNILNPPLIAVNPPINNNFKNYYPANKFPL